MLLGGRRTWLAGAPLNFVYREQIDMAKQAIAETDKRIETFLSVGYLFDEQVFKAYASTGFFDVGNKGFLEFWQGNA